MADASNSYFLLSKDTKGEWRWNFKAKNHQIIADSAEGYINRQDAIYGINFVKQNASSSGTWDADQQKWL